tara:strand:- start:113 stop:985 length:873 start_codon:yes stop_codon:yes gene_type:complete
MPMNRKVEEIETIETLEDFFSNVSYKELYSLPPEDFFKQVMIRDRYFAVASTQYSKNKSTFIPLIEMMLNGYVIFDKNIFEKYTPKSVTILPHHLPKGINLLSFRKSIFIASDLLGLVDEGYLTLKELPKENTLHDHFYYSPKQNAMKKNVSNEDFSDQSYQDVMTKHSLENEKQIKDIILEVDITTPEEELVKNFREIIRARKKSYEHIEKPTESAKIVIKKCERYKVIEAHDIKKLSEIFKVKLSQQKLSSIIFEELRGEKGLDDYRKTTKEYMEKIFNHSYYTQFLK